MSDNNEKYLLVSDSNEKIQQMDSKKLSYDGLVQMARDNLFKKLDVFQRYITKNQYDAYVSGIQIEEPTFDKPIGKKFTAVDGQVILIEKNSVPQEIEPLAYLKSKWDIETGMSVVQLQNCMLRGMVNVEHDTIQKPGNRQVFITSENLPAHMHHSGITDDKKMSSIGGSGQQSQHSTPQSNETRCDLFYNDSIAIGLDRNEMDGTVDEFAVQSSGDGDAVSHNNLPKYHEFYVFVVEKSA